jgi:hypothetical protein
MELGVVVQVCFAVAATDFEISLKYHHLKTGKHAG